jgi:glycosyltransferase involved in cell wall biosynthesis
VVAEALACGIPVLISNKVNIWREIESERAGFVEEDSLEGTVKLLDTWARITESERATVKANARRCFENHFDLDRNGVRLLEMIRSLKQADPAD